MTRGRALKQSAKPDLLEGARRDLSDDIAEAAVAVEVIERRISELRQQQTFAGYELVTARAELRAAVSRLEQHDANRELGARS